MVQKYVPIHYCCFCRSISNDQLTVLQNYSREGVPTSLTQLGRQVQIIFTATNGGPSSIGQGRLTIRIPTRNPCTRNAFLFYLASVTVSECAYNSCDCSEVVNCVNNLSHLDIKSWGILYPRTSQLL